MWVFDVNQRNVGASAAGAALTTLTQYGSNAPSFGGDMLSDPVAQTTAGAFVNTGCGNAADYYQAKFSLPTNINTVRQGAAGRSGNAN